MARKSSLREAAPVLLFLTGAALCAQQPAAFNRQLPPGGGRLAPSEAGSSASAGEEARHKSPQHGGVFHDNRHPLPTFRRSYEINHVRYTATFVGQDPERGPSATVIPTVMFALRIIAPSATPGAPDEIFDPFTDIDPAYGDTPVNVSLRSPIFTPAHFTAGTTDLGVAQFSDVLQRAQFWSSAAAQSNSYHVRLAMPVVKRVTLRVPADKVIARLLLGVPLIDPDWYEEQLHAIMRSNGIQPGTLPIFVTRDCRPDFGGGYHFAASLSGDPREEAQTYISYRYVVKLAGAPTGLPGVPVAPDVLALSHEVAEWLNDPFVDNIVPPWVEGFVASSGFLFCNILLEVGDNLEFLPGGGAFPVVSGGATFHLQDEVLFSWFTGEASSFVNGWQSLQGMAQQSTYLPCVQDLYTFETLDVPGAVESYPEGINDKGDVTGSYLDASLAFHGFVRQHGVFRTLDVPGSLFTAAVSINNKGQVAGYFVDSGFASHGFLYDGKFKTIDYPGALATRVLGLNDKGEITGDRFDGSHLRGFVLRTSGAFEDIAPTFAANSTAEQIDNEGQIVGDYNGGNPSDNFAFQFDRGKFAPFTLFSERQIFPGGLSDSATSGFFVDRFGIPSGFLRSDDNAYRVTWLGPDPTDPAFLIFGTTIVRGINQKKEMVGYYAQALVGEHDVIIRLKNPLPH